MSASHPHMQALLSQLAAHVSSASVSSTLPASSSSAPVGLPPSWRSVGDLLREMRLALTTLYAPVLTEEQRERAVGWGWEARDARVTLDNAAVASSSLSTSSSSASAPAADGASTAPHPHPASTLHRFDVPVSTVRARFSNSCTLLSRTLHFHTALIATLQAAAKALPPGAPVPPSASSSPAAQVQPLARQYLFYLKQRLDMQRQGQKLSRAFDAVQEAIHSELSSRRARALDLLPSSSLPLDSELPQADLHALSSALAHVRSQLGLTNGAEDPSSTHSTLAPGEVSWRSDRRADDSVLEPATEGEPIVLAHLPAERHAINLSSTGATTCFVLDLVLTRPLLHGERERALLRQTVEAVRKRGGIDAVDARSALGQVLRFGFAAHGTLQVMFADAASADDELVSLALDDAAVRNLLRGEIAALRAKIAMLVENEATFEANSGQELYLRRKQALAAFEQLVASPAAAPKSLPSDPEYIVWQRRVEQRLEGPVLELARVCWPSSIVPSGGGDEMQSAWSLAYVGVEKVERTLPPPSASASTDAMDTSSSATPTSESFFAYRFLLSQPVCMPFAEARDLFGTDWYAVPLSPLNAEDASTSTATTVDDDASFHALALGRRARSLRDDDSGEWRWHEQSLWGGRQRWKLNGAATVPGRAVRLSSFLLRRLESLPKVIEELQLMLTFQHLYRSAFRPLQPISATAGEVSSSAAVAPLPSASANSHAPPSTAVPRARGKLRLSYRDLLDDDAPPAPVKGAPHSTLAVPASVAPATAVLISAGYPSTLRAVLAHPRTGVPLTLTLRVESTAEGDVRLECSEASCSDGSVPSAAYVTRIIRCSGSLPIVLHYVLQRCTK